jgi:hypothetical protein
MSASRLLTCMAVVSGGKSTLIRPAPALPDCLSAPLYAIVACAGRCPIFDDLYPQQWHPLFSWRSSSASVALLMARKVAAHCRSRSAIPVFSANGSASGCPGGAREGAKRRPRPPDGRHGASERGAAAESRAHDGPPCTKRVSRDAERGDLRVDAIAGCALSISLVKSSAGRSIASQAQTSPISPSPARATEGRLGCTNPWVKS